MCVCACVLGFPDVIVKHCVCVCACVLGFPDVIVKHCLQCCCRHNNFMLCYVTLCFIRNTFL